MTKNTQFKNQTTAVYKGIEYDVSPFLESHPGGPCIIKQLLSSRQNITEVFKAIHPPQAELKLLSLKQIRKVDRSKQQKFYCRVEESLNSLYQISIPIQILIFVLIAFFFSAGLLSSNPIGSITSLSISQIAITWNSHSLLHNRSKSCKNYGKFLGCLGGGLTFSWFWKKHLRHHIFTNSDELDNVSTIRSNTFLYPFIFWKFKLDSIACSLRGYQIKEIVMLIVHYWLLNFQHILFVILALFISSFIISSIIFNPHLDMKRTKKGVINSFIEQQLASTKDTFSNEVVNFMTGGFQLHCEHHLFPQVPFYNLPLLRKILKEELPSIKCSIEENSYF